VLVAALLAGTPAGLGVMIVSVLIVWWVFISPGHEFNSLGRTDVANFLIFIASSVIIVIFGQSYRDALRRLRQRDRERNLLLNELEHRGRNTYAVVESIVRNTLVHDRESADAIAGRVQAVSSANDLINWADTKTVQLPALLSLVLAAADTKRVSTYGPAVELSANACRKLSLVFHELLINAMKYGSLSTPAGRVDIEWRINGNKVQLVWKESAGPTIGSPQRTGFGTTVVTLSLASLSGGIVFAFNPEGLRCDIDFNAE
jgi:two-component sensor histidine kinase